MSSGVTPIRVGVVGAGRGVSLASLLDQTGFELAALCDVAPPTFDVAPGVAVYTDFERFLTHDLDAVILANFFHEHAPFAIRSLEAGKHVLSETAACHTLGEGVALIEAVERSGLVYSFAENYPFMAYNQEMRRRFRAGEVGEFRYGEGEYVHPDPAEVKLARSPGFDHWRNWIPATYYCTHSLAPVMYITGTRPIKVNAFVVPYDFDDPTHRGTAKRSDTAATIICRMDNGAVVKSLHGALRGHGNYVRIHGNRGLMENCRHGDQQRLRVWREPWEKGPDEHVELVYRPEFPTHHTEASRAGHGGGDFFVLKQFHDAIRRREMPAFDVFAAVKMSMVGVQAWRSALADSAPFEIPDFRSREVRDRYRHDHWSPDPKRRTDGQPPSSVLGEIELDDETRRFAASVWSAESKPGSG